MLFLATGNWKVPLLVIKVRDLDGDRVEGEFYSLPQEVGISSSRSSTDLDGDRVEEMFSVLPQETGGFPHE